MTGSLQVFLGENMKSKQLKYSLLLLLTAMIWGSAFVAQSAGMDYVGPFTFLCVRNIIGFLVLIPVMAVFSDKSPGKEPGQKKTLFIGAIVCGFFLFTASAAQQIGIQYTTAGKAGFITAFYIVLVPIFGLTLKKRPGKLVWVSVAIAIVGLYFLCFKQGEGLGLNKADIYLFACAVLFSCQILAVDYFAPRVDPVKLSAYQYLAVAVMSLVPMLLEKPGLNDIAGAWLPIGYAGVFSSGVAYTLQIVAQKEVKPAVASILMSLEAVFSVIFGFLILKEVLSLREGLGCILMFTAVILCQFEPSGDRKKEAS